MRRTAAAVLLTLSYAGCTRADAGAPSPTPRATVAASAAPLAVSSGGPVIRAPRIVYITFDDDPLREDIRRFHTSMERSTYWSSRGEEYDVGPLGRSSEIEGGAAPTTIDRSEIEAWLADRVGESADPQALYAVFYPGGTTVTYGGHRSCGFNGFHGETSIRGRRVGFAVLPRCDAIAPFGSTLDRLTMTAMHEYFEWATDPFPSTERAYHSMSAEGAAWALAYAAELSDLCFGEDMRVVPPDLGFAVQRVWSNRAAASGRDPCQPRLPDAPYTVVRPALEDRILLPATLSEEVASREPVPGIAVAPGETREVDLELLGDAPIGGFALAVAEGGRMARSQGVELSLTEPNPTAARPGRLRVRAPPSFATPTVAILFLHRESDAPSTRIPFIVGPRS